jgi:hypothetical protein
MRLQIKPTSLKITAMKRIIYIISLVLAAVVSQAQPVCCPKFSLQQAGDIRTCQGDSSCKGSSGAAGKTAHKLT